MESFFKALIASAPELIFPVISKAVMDTLKNPNSSKGKILKPLAVNFARAVIARFPDDFDCE